MIINRVALLLSSPLSLFWGVNIIIIIDIIIIVTIIIIDIIISTSCAVGE